MTCAITALSRMVAYFGISVFFVTKLAFSRLNGFVSEAYFDCSGLTVSKSTTV